MPHDFPPGGFVAKAAGLFVSREFGRFLIAGGFAAAVNFSAGLSVRTAFGEKTHAASVLVGFLAGTFASFFLNKYYTFRAHAEPTTRQALKYALAAVVGMAFAIAAGELLLSVGSRLTKGSVSESTLGSLAHVTSIGLATGLNFITVKFFALKARAPVR